MDTHMFLFRERERESANHVCKKSVCINARWAPTSYKSAYNPYKWPKAGITGIPRAAEWMEINVLSSCNGMWTHLGAPIPPVEKFCPHGEKPQGLGCSRCVRGGMCFEWNSHPDEGIGICKRSFLLGVVREISPFTTCNTTFHHNKMHRNEIFNHYNLLTTKKYPMSKLTFSPLRNSYGLMISGFFNGESWGHRALGPHLLRQETRGAQSIATFTRQVWLPQKGSLVVRESGTQNGLKSG